MANPGSRVGPEPGSRGPLLARLAAVGLLAFFLFVYPRVFLAAGELLHLSPLLRQLWLGLAVTGLAAGLLWLGYDRLWRRLAGGGRIEPAIRTVGFFLVLAMVAISNLALTVDDLKGVILRSFLLFFFLHQALTRSLRLPASRGLRLALLAHLVAVALAAALAWHPLTAFRWVGDQFLLVGFVIILADRVSGAPAARLHLLVLLGILAALGSLYGLAQFAGFDPIPWPGDLKVYGETQAVAQAAGLFGNPNFFGVMAVVGLVTALAGALGFDHPWARPLFGFAALCNLAGLFVSFSRAAWLTAAVVGTVALVGVRRRGTRLTVPPRLRVGLVVAALLLVAGLGWYRDVVAARLVSYLRFGRSVSSRLYLYQSALTLVRERPLLGWGPDNFQYVFERTVNPAFYLLYPPSLCFLKHTHNEYLQLFAETGLLGLVPFLTALGLILAGGWRQWRSGSGPVGAALLAVIALLVADLFSMNLRYLLFRFVLWLLLALLIADDRRAPAAPVPVPGPPLLRRVFLTLIALGTVTIFAQPFLGSCYTRLGLIYPRTDRAERNLVRAFFWQALEYDETALMALAELARLHLRTGDDPEALAVLQRMQALSPAFGNNDYHLGLVLHRLGREEEARTHLGRARAREPLIPPAFPAGE